MKEIIWNEESIKEAVKHFNNWQGKALVMADKSDGKVWTDIFADDTTWKEYHSKSIFTVYDKDGLYQRNERINVKFIKYLLQ